MCLLLLLLTVHSACILSIDSLYILLSFLFFHFFVFVLVHRHHGWVGLLVTSFLWKPTWAYVVNSGTIKSDSHGGGTLEFHLGGP